MGMGNNDVVTIECHMDKPYKYVILRPKHCKDEDQSKHYFHLSEVVQESSTSVFRSATGSDHVQPAAAGFHVQLLER